MDNKRIDDIAARYELKGFRAKQLRAAFFEQRVDGFDAVTTLSKDLRARLAAETVLTVEPTTVLVAGDGRAFKALMRLHDGKMVETVLLNPKPGLWSTCISSQVGCALACTFCATGSLGFTRNLTREEITDQVLFWWQYIAREGLDANLRNIVFMGQGEPFMNRTEVFAAVEELMNPATFGIGARHISISTVGVVRAIRELAERFPQVNLAISLHAPTDDLRLSLMPINKGIPLEKLGEALRDYMETTNRKLFIEYILLARENDQISHADQLVEYLTTLGSPTQVHVNLIVYNPIDAREETAPTSAALSHGAAAPHTESPRDVARAFRDRLISRGISATIRRNLGRDIDGACGQLALKDRQAG